MQFQVPQFIEIEDKIIGNFTFKQFVYLAGGAGLSYILYASLPSFAAFFFIVPVLAFSAALAFYKVNGKPFIHVVEAAIRYVFSEKLYVWKKREPKPVRKDEEKAPEPIVDVPRLSDSKLKELSWSLDVHKNIDL